MKSDYTLKVISKDDCKDLLRDHHYLTAISNGFKSGYNVGLFKGDAIVGVCIFTGFPVPELAKGMLGLKRDDQEGLFELSRLVLCPSVQKDEHNITSWFVSRSIRLLRTNNKVRVLLSYADADYHQGTIYRACNFTYYGLTTPKKDFWLLQDDGTHKKHVRGKMKGLAGEWRDRSRKHRFVMVFDKKLKILWNKVDFPKQSD